MINTPTHSRVHYIMLTVKDPFLKTEHADFMPARISLGLLLYSQGNVVDAQSEWEKILYKEPDHKEANLYLRMARRATETTV